MAQALFDINADGGNQGFAATNSQVLTLRLRQQPPLGVASVLWQVFDSAGFDATLGIAANPPRASLNAPVLTVVGATSGPSASPASVDGSVTITMPVTGSHSWIVRCVVNGGFRTLPGGQQVLDPTLIQERGIYIPTVSGVRKVVCTELRQFSDGGWADALDALAAGGVSDPYAGIDTTGITDSTAALQALIQPTSRPAADAFGDFRMTVDLPPGARIRISAQLQITRTVHIRGNGARVFCKTDTGFCDMIKVHDTAPFTSIDNVKFLYWKSSVQLEDSSFTGIKVECFGVTLRDVVVDGAGWGYDFGTDSEAHNTNSTFVENCWALNSRRGGMKVIGTDCSAGLYLGFRTLVTENHFESVNGAGAAIGILECAANGNTYVGSQVEVSNEGIVIQPRGGVAPSTFVGQYIEDSDGAYWRPSLGTSGTDYSGNTTVVGGHLAALQETRNDRFGARATQATFRQAHTARRSGLPTLTFANSGGSDTITRSAGAGGGPVGSWLTDGFRPNMLFSADGTVSNNVSNAPLVDVSATVLTFGAGTALVNETLTNTAEVHMTAVATAYSAEIPAESQSSALLFRAEDNALSTMLLKFNGATPGTEKWALQAYLSQSNDLLGTKVVDIGGGNYDVSPVIGAAVPQTIAGTGSWNSEALTAFITGSGARTITVPNAAKINTTIEFLDVGGNAAAGNITLDPSGAGTINGAATLVLSTNYEIARLKYVAADTWVRV